MATAQTLIRWYSRLVTGLLMLTVDLKRLGKHAGPAVRYLNSQLEEPLRVRGSQVQLTSTRARTAKLLLRKFLRQRGLENCRVVMVHPGLVVVLGPKDEKRATLETLSVFPVNETIPYYQVAAGWGVVPKPWARRRWKP